MAMAMETWLGFSASVGLRRLKRLFESAERLEDIVFYSLCAAYAAVAIVALVQLIRIQMRVPEYGWTIQKIFHLMNFIVNGVRAVVFGFHDEVFLLRPKVIALVLLDLPSLLFFTTFTLLVLFWAEIYHQARNMPAGKLKIIYFIVNCAIYLFQVCIWIYIGIDDSDTITSISRIFMSVISFLAALGFILYGGRIFKMLWRFPIESRGRRQKIHEVGSVTAICFTCFLVRCVVIAVSAFKSTVCLDVLNHLLMDLVFYLVTEILPSALVLYILRKLPTKRISGQYHPIS